MKFTDEQGNEWLGVHQSRCGRKWDITKLDPIQAVDLSFFEGNLKILGRFSNSDAISTSYGYLNRIIPETKEYRNSYGCCFKEFRPIMNRWHSEKEFGDVAFEVIKGLSEAGFYVQTCRENHDFQIIGLKDRYCWPWDLDYHNEV